LAQLISKSSKETKLRSEAAAESLFEAEGEEAELESATPVLLKSLNNKKTMWTEAMKIEAVLEEGEATEAEVDNFLINLPVRMTLMT
jgi:hypothetical protein